MTAQSNWRKASTVWGMEAAENAATSSDTLTKLALHKDARVRTAVAENPNTLVTTVMRLAQDRCVDLRYTIAENHQMDRIVLCLLLLDDNPYVAHRAERTLMRCAKTSNSQTLPIVPDAQRHLRRVS